MTEDQESGINHWLRLPDEMALHIFRLLPPELLKTVALVNKEFRILSNSLWTGITLDFEDKHTIESCRDLVQRCTKLASLKISNKYYNWNVRALNIMTVVIIAERSLKNLEVDKSIRMWTPAAMSKIGQLKNLRSLTLMVSLENNKSNMYVEANMLKELANLDNLELLNLKITKNQVAIFPLEGVAATMKAVFEKLNKLKEVKLSLPCCDDEGLVDALAKSNPDLTVLHLSMDYHSLSDQTIELLANSCPGLEDFRYRCDRRDGVNRALTDGGIERMVGSAKNLKHLRLFICQAPRVTKDLARRLELQYPYLRNVILFTYHFWLSL